MTGLITSASNLMIPRWLQRDQPLIGGGGSANRRFRHIRPEKRLVSR
jgi:hypothetical protein